MTEPATYPDGTQWAIKHNYRREPSTGAVTKQVWYQQSAMDVPIFDQEDAEFYFAHRLSQARHEFPDSPELWPQLVRAEIVWQVVE